MGDCMLGMIYTGGGGEKTHNTSYRKLPTKKYYNKLHFLRIIYTLMVIYLYVFTAWTVFEHPHIRYYNIIL